MSTTTEKPDLTEALNTLRATHVAFCRVGEKWRESSDRPWPWDYPGYAEAEHAVDRAIRAILKAGTP